MACKRSAVRSRLPPPEYREVQDLTLSSRGLGHHPFTVSTGVRIPVGTPNQGRYRKRYRPFCLLAYKILFEDCLRLLLE